MVVENARVVWCCFFSIKGYTGSSVS